VPQILRLHGTRFHPEVGIQDGAQESGKEAPYGWEGFVSKES
jgi:hypothetical protein